MLMLMRFNSKIYHLWKCFFTQIGRYCQILIVLHERMILVEDIHPLEDIIRPFSQYLPLACHYTAD